MTTQKHFYGGFVMALLLLAFPLGSLFFIHKKEITDTAPAEILPDVHFVDGKGNDVQLSQFKGQVVLVNLWAPWCKPCVEELPALDKLQKSLQGKGFSVVAISLDRQPLADAQAFLDKNKVRSFKTYWDKNHEIQLKWHYEGLPTSFLLDKQGKVVRRYEGAAKWADQTNAILPLLDGAKK